MIVIYNLFPIELRIQSVSDALTKFECLDIFIYPFRRRGKQIFKNIRKNVKIF